MRGLARVYIERLEHQGILTIAFIKPIGNNTHRARVGVEPIYLIRHERFGAIPV
jgi:hypothetical protein